MRRVIRVSPFVPMENLEQLTMFGVDPNPEYVFDVYHDESGTYHRLKGDRWLLHGVLFVPTDKKPDVISALRKIRNDTGYFGEIHYVKLRKSTKGSKAQCAKGWLQTYARNLSDTVFYHCLAVDTHSSGFEHQRFGKAYHVYNYFARTALVGGIAWSLKRYKKVAMSIYSDKKSRQRGNNFAAYIPREVSKAILAKRSRKKSSYPEIRLTSPTVALVDSDPANVPSDIADDCELIQLVDLLTSSIAQALSATSGQKAKVMMAEIVADWIADTRKPPWLQSKELHRRFSLSCFPDEKGRFYTPGLKIIEKKQPKLL